jgi:hypothetical protein
MGFLSERLRRTQPQQQAVRGGFLSSRLSRRQGSQPEEQEGITSVSSAPHLFGPAGFAFQQAERAGFMEGDGAVAQASQAANTGVARGFNWVTEQLSRGTYAGTAALRQAAESAAEVVVELNPVRKAVVLATSGWRTLWAGIREGVVPQQRMNAVELLDRGAPDFVREHPRAAGVLGFVADIAVDPTTYLTFGSSSATRVAQTTVGLDPLKLTRLMQRAGIAPDLFEGIAKRFGREPERLARAQAWESNAALERAWKAERAEIGRDYVEDVRSLVASHGSKAVADSRPLQAQEVSATAVLGAQEMLAAAEKKVRRIDNILSRTRAPKKQLEWGRRKLEAEEEVRRARAHFERVSQPDELRDAADAVDAFGRQRQMFADVLPASFRGPVPGQPELTAEAARVAGNRRAFPAAPSRLTEAPSPGFTEAPAQAHRAALQEKFEAARQRMTERVSRLDAAREGMRGRVFRTAEDMDAAFSELLGAEKRTKIVWDSDFARGERLLSDPAVVESLRDRGGVKVMGRTVVSQEVLSRAAKITGFDRVLEHKQQFSRWLNDTAPWLRGRDTPIQQNLTQTVNMPDGRAVPLGKAYLEARRHYESWMDAADDIAFRDTIERFSALTRKGAEKVGRLMWDLDDVLSGKGLGKDLTPSERIAAAQRLRSEANLAPDEDAAFVAYRSTMAQMGQVEQEAGILKHLHDHYFARYFRPNSAVAKRDETARVAAEQVESIRGAFDAQIPGANPGFAKERKFSSIADAQQAGFEPVFDLMASYALRVTQHRRALAKKQFQDSLMHMFPEAKLVRTGNTGKGSGDAAEFLGGTKLVGVPKEITRDLRFMGDGIYPKDAWNGHAFWRKYDGAMGFWRKGATVMRPAFGIRQSVSNMLQLALIQGMKAFDPRSMGDAFSLLNGNGLGARGDAPMVLRTLLGEEVTGPRLLEEMAGNGILRNVTVEGIGPGSNPRYQDRLLRSIHNASLVHKLAPKSAAAQGLLHFARGSFRYTDFPAVVENFSRAVGYINARRAGFSPTEAAKHVDRALFDYLHGLQAAEARWVKRLVPFYTYQRFALPMMAQVLTHTPGRVTNLAKATDAFFGAWNTIANDSELTERERRVLPGWLLEQPAALRYSLEAGKAVGNTFNNFTPLDVLSTLAPGGGASVEQETAEVVRKVGLAQLAPWVKVPLELAFQRDAFTGRVLEENGLRDLNGHVDQAQFTQWLMAGLAGWGTSGDPKYMALAGYLGHQGAEMAPDATGAVLRFLTGWEEGINPDTGERTVYVSPYRWHLFTSLMPQLSDALRLAKTEQPALQRTMQVLFGVGTVERDLEEEQNRRFSEMDRAEARQQKRVDDAEDAMLYQREAEERDRLRQLLEQIEAEEAAIDGPVRSGGGP